MAPDTWVALGVLGRAHGLAGAVLFHPYNQAGDALDRGTVVRLRFTDGTTRNAVFSALDPNSKGWVVRFDSVTTRTDAEALNHAVVELQRKDFPPLEEGEYYHVDLVGVVAHDPAGAIVGTVVRVEPWPSVDSLVIERPDGTSLEAPVVPGIVSDLDLDARTVVVHLDALDPV